CVEGAIDTGRSTLCHALATFLREECKKNVAVLAPTHATAQRIGGQTVHSWIGQAFREHEIEGTIKQIRRNDELTRRWQDIDVIVIDEAQSIECTLFDDMDAIAQTIRDNEAPFGGIQGKGASRPLTPAQRLTPI